jgi:hypothetical protein
MQTVLQLPHCRSSYCSMVPIADPRTVPWFPLQILVLFHGSHCRSSYCSMVHSDIALTKPSHSYSRKQVNPSQLQQRGAAAHPATPLALLGSRPPCWTAGLHVRCSVRQSGCANVMGMGMATPQAAWTIKQVPTVAPHPSRNPNPNRTQIPTPAPKPARTFTG